MPDRIDMPGPESSQLMEILKLLATILSPIITGFFALYILKRGIFVEKDKHLNQEIIKRRLKFYDDVAPNLNKLYCFYRVVGDWHGLAPSEIIKLKREIDQQFHMYRYILSEEVFQGYVSFMKTYFQEFAADGVPAKLRADREHLKKLMSSRYDARWEVDFADTDKCCTWEKHRDAYDALMAKLGNNVLGSVGSTDQRLTLRS